MPRPKITEDQLDELTAALIPALNAIADLAMGPPPARCDRPNCQRAATRTAVFRYFASSEDTRLTETPHEVCAFHADILLAAQARRALVYAGRPCVGLYVRPGVK